MAFEWYMKAAELGDVYGCFNVGECYYHGKGVEQDAVKARQTSSRIALSMISEARATLPAGVIFQRPHK